MPSEWTHTKQRDDLKCCPFCNTAAIEQCRLADTSTDMLWQIQCGNPFCTVTCKTWTFVDRTSCEQAWQDRKEPHAKQLEKALQGCVDALYPYCRDDQSTNVTSQMQMAYDAAKQALGVKEKA